MPCDFGTDHDQTSSPAHVCKDFSHVRVCRRCRTEYSPCNCFLSTKDEMCSLLLIGLRQRSAVLRIIAVMLQSHQVRVKVRTHYSVLALSLSVADPVCLQLWLWRVGLTDGHRYLANHNPNLTLHYLDDLPRASITPGVRICSSKQISMSGLFIRHSLLCLPNFLENALLRRYFCVE